MPDCLRRLWRYYSSYYADLHNDMESPLLDPALLCFTGDRVVKEAALTPEDIDLLLAHGLVKEIDPEQISGWLHVFTVRELKSTGPRRRLITEPFVNDVLPIDDEYRFALPGPHTVIDHARRFMTSRRAKFRPRVYATCVDLQYFYGQLPLDERLKPAHCFVAGGKTYSLQTVPTGGRHVVGYAQCILLSLLDGIRSVSARSVTATVDGYIDNVRIMSDSAVFACECVESLYTLASSAGLTFNESLSEALAQFTEEQHEFLGFVFDMRNGKVTLQQKLKSKLAAGIGTVSAHASTWKEVEKLAGVWMHACQLDRSFLTSAFHVLKYLRRRAREQLDGTQPAAVWRSIVPLWQSQLTRLQNVCHNLLRGLGSASTLYTDASLSGWGAVAVLPSGACVTLSGAWTAWESSNLHINELEVEAVRRALQYLSLPRNSQLHLVIDNTTAKAVISKGRSSAFFINKRVEEIQQYLRRQRWNISSVSYIASAENPADWFSRVSQSLPSTSSEFNVTSESM